MNILVAGGTGFIGSQVVRETLAGVPEARVRVLTRAAKRRPSDSRISFAEGDVTVPGTLDAAVRDADVVVHCVQFPNHPVENPAKGWTYERVDGQGTRNVLSACTRAGVRRFVYLSGAGVGPGRKEPWFRAKFEAEQAVINSGMEYAILRPSWIYGPEDKSLNRFVFFARYLPFVPVIGSGKGRIQPLSVFDAARVAARCSSHPVPINRIFELGGPQQLSMDDILRTVQKVLRRRRVLLHFPAGLVKSAAHILKLLPNAPLSPDAVDFILMEQSVNARPVEEFFAMRFEDLETGLRRYLK
jgi:uncharacterized protein YbjT (DUF2867 family)